MSAAGLLPPNKLLKPIPDCHRCWINPVKTQGARGGKLMIKERRAEAFKADVQDPAERSPLQLHASGGKKRKIEF